MCSYAANYCDHSIADRDDPLIETTQTWTTAGKSTNIKSAALAKYDVDSGTWDSALGAPPTFSITFDASSPTLSGTWSQKINSPSDIIAHYIVVKGGNVG